MSTTTFGYDAREDRLWLTFEDDPQRLWLTRYLVQQFLASGLRLLEGSAPGAQGGGSAQTRVSLEHELALNELRPGEEKLPWQVKRGEPQEPSEQAPMLCTGMTVSFGASKCQITFMCDEQRRELTMDRTTMHRWLHGLHLALQDARWNLTDVPEWLGRSQLPQAVRALLDAPLPDDLDADSDEGDSR